MYNIFYVLLVLSLIVVLPDPAKSQTPRLDQPIYDHLIMDGNEFSVFPDSEYPLHALFVPHKLTGYINLNVVFNGPLNFSCAIHGSDPDLASANPPLVGNFKTGIFIENLLRQVLDRMKSENLGYRSLELMGMNSNDPLNFGKWGSAKADGHLQISGLDKICEFDRLNQVYGKRDISYKGVASEKIFPFLKDQDLKRLHGDLKQLNSKIPKGTNGVVRLVRTINAMLDYLPDEMDTNDRSESLLNLLNASYLFASEFSDPQFRTFERMRALSYEDIEVRQTENTIWEFTNERE